MPHIRSGGFVGTQLTVSNEEYRVVGVKKTGALIPYGKFLNLGEAQEVADKNTDETQICIVYGEDSRVVYSTER